jgi:hypothetical protein
MSKFIEKDNVIELITKKVTLKSFNDSTKEMIKNKILNDFNQIKSSKLPLPISNICGKLKWDMSKNDIINVCRKLFGKLKYDNTIISYEYFSKNFNYTNKHKNFRKIYIDINGKKWIENGNEFTRVLGSKYIKSLKTEFNAPDQLIVCNSSEFINVKINFNFRDRIKNDIFNYPPPFPVISSIENGFILSEYIENGIPICREDMLEDYPSLYKIGFIDFKFDNILRKNDSLWIVDCEMHSFVFCRSLLLYFSPDDEKIITYNRKTYNNKYTLYYFFKFLIENKDIIQSREVPIIQDNEDNIFLAECLRNINGYFTLDIPLD